MERQRYRLNISPVFLEDVERIYNYISVELVAIIAADNLLKLIKQVLENLEYYPYMGNEIQRKVFGNMRYRKINVNNYLIFYFINENKNEINIMRMIYGARHYEGLI